MNFSSSLLVVLSIFQVGASAQNLSRPPNIILVYADDLGIGDLGVYGQLVRAANGQPAISTPNLDEMARDGAIFSQFYAPAPVCQPSRVNLFTGQHAGHAYDGNNRPHPTMPHQLRSAGYATSGFGKWGGGFMEGGNADDPVGEEGFDYWFGYNSHGDAHHYYPDPNQATPEFLWRDTSPAPNDAQQIALNNDRANGIKNDYAPDLIADDAMQWMANHTASNPDQPFFMFVADPSPHFHFEIDDSLNPYLGESWPSIEQAYAATVTRMDYNVGRIKEKLVELGIEDNSLIVFTSDNGPHKTGSQGFPGQEHNPNFFDSDGQHGGRKRTLGEAGIRMPTVAFAPGMIEPGSVVDRWSHGADLMATFMNLAGGVVEGDVDGVSLVPALSGEGSQAEHTYQYWHYNDEHSVRLGDLRVTIRVGEEGEPDAGELVFAQLYDLSDPNTSPRVGGNYNNYGDLRAAVGGVLGAPAEGDAWVDDVFDIIQAHGSDSLPFADGDGTFMPNAGFDVEMSFDENGDMVAMLDAALTTDADTAIGDLTFMWTIDGSAQPASGQQLQHTFDTEGWFNIRLEVSDDQGHLDTAIKTIAARSPLPGDANLDGTVSIADFAILQNHFNQQGRWVCRLKFWIERSCAGMAFRSLLRTTRKITSGFSSPSPYPLPGGARGLGEVILRLSLTVLILTTIAVVGTSSARASLLTDLELYYKFDPPTDSTASGGILDRSGNDRDGSIVTANGGAADLDGSPMSSPVIMSTGELDLTGNTAGGDTGTTASSWVDSDTPGYNGVTGTTARSVAFWMKSEDDDDNATGTVVETLVAWGLQQNTGGDGARNTIRINDNGANGTVDAVRFEVDGGYFIANTDVDDDLWHHIVVIADPSIDGNAGTFDVSTDVQIYVDGMLDAGGGTGDPPPSGTLDEPINTSAANRVNIGKDPNFSDRVLSGLMDEVAIWSRALTADEIAFLYNDGAGQMIPEPSSFVLAGLGLLGLIAFAVRRRG